MKDLPENIKAVNVKFEDFAQKFQDFFPFDIKLNSPYKLCDFKIFYGGVLKKYVDPYDFWGFCDCDLIWGDIRKFITDDMLSKYNHLYGLGHFQLQKVEDPEYMRILENTRAKGKYDYKYVLGHEANFVIDELPFGLPMQYYKENRGKYYVEFEDGGRPYDSPLPDYFQFMDGFNCMNELGREFKLTMYFKYRNIVPFWQRSFDSKKAGKKNIIYRYSAGNLEKIFYQNGQIRSEEILYAHFMKRKLKVVTDNQNKYLIVPNKFVDYKEDISKSYLWIHGRKRLNLKRYIERIRIKFGSLKQNLLNPNEK
jgi:hypothetical protein